MTESFRLVSLRHTQPPACDLSFLSRESAERVRRFHQSFPQYHPTPLRRLTATAQALGLNDVCVKDESFRFGLNAFKVLGGSYAIARELSRRLGISPEEMTFERLSDPRIRARLGDLTFVTATDGNHGRGVAWAASRFGFRSVVYMPHGSAEERLNNIRAEGAEASITDLNYDDAVRLASRMAQERGWVMVQDTAWEGYEDIPRWIMQGYATMGMEAMEQLPWKPTHVFLQAGVGSMAGAIAGLFQSVYGAARPTVAVVEPNKADCVFRTAQAGDGQRHFVTGAMDTIMAGLACGEPCSIGWEILSGCADHFLSCPDYAAAQGMRVLASPLGEDPRVVSGESGAAGFGCVCELMRDPALAPLREQLGLNETSRVLLFSTEGDTDRENYRRIVWDGAYRRG